MNTVKKLRKSLGLSRRAFADLLALSESRVEQIEAEPNDELTAKLARIAEEHGLHEIAAELRGSAEDAAPAPPSIDKLVNRALAAGDHTSPPAFRPCPARPWRVIRDGSTIILWR